MNVPLSKWPWRGWAPTTLWQWTGLPVQDAHLCTGSVGFVSYLTTSIARLYGVRWQDDWLNWRRSGWKELWSVLSQQCLEGLRKTSQHFSRDIWWPGLELNWVPLQYKHTALTVDWVLAFIIRVKCKPGRFSDQRNCFFLIRLVRGGVQTGSTRHVGHWMAYCTCPGW
jgi:hypothetical protein